MNEANVSRHDANNSKRLMLIDIQGKPWAEAFIREMELVVAANVHRGMCGLETISDAILERRVTEHCAHLDLDCTPRFAGIVTLPHASTNNPECWPIYDALAALPRGAFQIWKSPAGGYDIYASNGLGGVSTPSGGKFFHQTARSPWMTFTHAYSAVISTLIHQKRQHIREEITAYTLSLAGIEIWSKHKNLQINGVTWSNVIYAGIIPNYYSGGGSAYALTASRRGSRKNFFVNQESMLQILGLTPVLPYRFIDPDNDKRISTLAELQQSMCQQAYVQLAAQHQLTAQWGCKAPFHVNGSSYERTVFSDDKAPVGRVEIQMTPGTAQIISSNFFPGCGINENTYSGSLLNGIPVAPALPLAA